jgi:small-conductance mechanosensitive channel/CRP-like cAMP-binding protein
VRVCPVAREASTASLTLVDRLGQSFHALLPFLMSNVSLVVGAVLLVLLFGIRAASDDKEFRRDLRGAFRFLSAFLILRVAAWAMPEEASPTLVKIVRVGWMLTFTFGVIRVCVALGLKLVRLRSQVPTPKILRDVVGFILYGLAALPILQTQLNLDLGGLLATSAVLSVVIGLALQETLGNLFAGLSLQLERPYQVGDHIRIKEYTGRVVQIGWRATRIVTFRRESITLPNSMVAKEIVKNFSYGYEPIAIDINLGLSYEAPPNQVKAAVLDVMKEVPTILPEPKAQCRTWAYEESSIKYMIRYWVADFSQADSTMEELYTRLWYRLKRENIDIPLPQRVVHLRNEVVTRPEFSAESVMELLRAVDLFTLLMPEELDNLRKELVARRFGKNERVIEEGEEGHTFYLVVSGEVSVRTARGHEVTRLKRGNCFGEMSLLTGEPRAATVVALEDSVLLELDRPAFARMFVTHPGLARQLSSLLAQRRTQLRAVAEASGGTVDAAPEANRILGRLRQIFSLDAQD